MMSPGSDRKRRADAEADDGTTAMDTSASSMTSPEGRATVRAGRSRAPVPVNQYYHDNCAALYNQYVEMLNQEFQQFMQNNPGADPYWHVCEYLYKIAKFKDMYQSPFVGKILTCGWSDTCALGYQYNTMHPKPTKVLKDLEIVKISAGSTYTIMISKDGNVYTFGGQDEGGMGREGDEYEGDLQVRGFIPSTNCPVANEDDCIVMVTGGDAKSLALSLHNNVYSFGCFRDYDDANLREKPHPANKPDKNGKLYPKGINSTPVHLDDMPPGKVTALASGAYASAAIVNGQVATWGVGTKGELGRPVPDSIPTEDTGALRAFTEDILRERFLKPTLVPSIRGKIAISIACGFGHLMVVVREQGSLESTVYGSGFNTDGQLGLEDFENRKLLTPLEYTKKDGMMIATVEAGYYHTLALTLDGKRLYACGRAADGQCGYSKDAPPENTMINKLLPVQFPTGDLEIEQISCGENHNLAIGKPKGGTREVYTWGSTVADDEACCLGHDEGHNEYRPRKLVLTKQKGGHKIPVEGGVWRQADGGASHSTFLFTSAVDAQPIAETTRNVRQKIAP